MASAILILGIKLVNPKLTNQLAGLVLGQSDSLFLR